MYQFVEIKKWSHARTEEITVRVGNYEIVFQSDESNSAYLYYKGAIKALEQAGYIPEEQ